jgi:mono/diheme cytochrome c family protein
MIATRRSAAAMAALLSASMYAGSIAQAADKPSIERGRYLAKTSGCNDCHTPGYAMSGGKVPESEWLVGDRLGWNGPWGTTYPANLRLSMQNLSEREWLRMAREKQLRPPMPWFALRDMTDSDLVSLYRFIRYLGPAGTPAPAYLPPGEEAQGLVIRFPAPPR